jgi:hypothetical protein
MRVSWTASPRGGIEAWLAAGFPVETVSGRDNVNAGKHDGILFPWRLPDAAWRLQMALQPFNRTSIAELTLSARTARLGFAIIPSDTCCCISQVNMS